MNNQSNIQSARPEEVLRLADEAGHILLENGAEISRVEGTMERIASAYGVNDGSFFVLSNGIITTGQQFAHAEFIPIRGTQLSRVVEVNQLSRDVADGKVPLNELESHLQAIRNSKGKPWWETILGITLGVSSFGILFGSSFADAAMTLVCGLLLGAFITFPGSRMSRIFRNLLGGLVSGLVCIIAYQLFPNTLHLPNMIIGTIIALVPGVSFTNGMRDLANEDYLAGVIRLMDAVLVFFCIAMGVALAFILENLFTGDLIQLSVPVTDPVTSAWYVQLPAAFVGTMGFSALFGSPRKFYGECGVVGMLGWAVYLWVATAPAQNIVAASFLGALTVATLGGILAIACKCPTTVFLICGIIPLVPGGGIFWTAYYVISNHLRLAATTGFTALKVTIAIAGGILIATAIAGILQKHVIDKIMLTKID